MEIEIEAAHKNINHGVPQMSVQMLENIMVYKIGDNSFPEYCKKPKYPDATVTKCSSSSCQLQSMLSFPQNKDNSRKTR